MTFIQLTQILFAFVFGITRNIWKPFDIAAFGHLPMQMLIVNFKVIMIVFWLIKHPVSSSTDIYRSMQILVTFTNKIADFPEKIDQL